MRVFLLSVIWLFLAVPSVASGAPDRIDAKFLAEISGHAVSTELVLTNNTPSNICFFLYAFDPQLLDGNGRAVPTHLGDLDPMGPPQQVQVVWNDGQHHTFTPILGLGEPFYADTEARQVARVTYHLKAYDCVLLFKRGLGRAPALIERELSVVPTFLK